MKAAQIEVRAARRRLAAHRRVRVELDRQQTAAEENWQPRVRARCGECFSEINKLGKCTNPKCHARNK